MHSQQQQPRAVSKWNIMKNSVLSSRWTAVFNLLASMGRSNPISVPKVASKQGMSLFSLPRLSSAVCQDNAFRSHIEQQSCWRQRLRARLRRPHHRLFFSGSPPQIPTSRASLKLVQLNLTLAVTLAALTFPMCGSLAHQKLYQTAFDQLEPQKSLEIDK